MSDKSSQTVAKGYDHFLEDILEVADLTERNLLLKDELKSSENRNASLEMRNWELENYVRGLEEQAEKQEIDFRNIQIEIAQLREKFAEEMANLNLKHSEEMKKVEEERDEKAKIIRSLTQLHQEYSKLFEGIRRG